MDKNEDFEPKNTNLNIYVRETSAKKMLNYLYSVGEPVKIKEICENTGLTETQVWGLVQYLGNLGAITKKYEMGPAKYQSPPRRHLLLSLNEKQRQNASRVISKYIKFKRLIGE